jgi:diketogulonate reductase-like aldo/keto reductase
MEQRPFGSTGVSVPVLGQGTWQMERDDRASCVTALRRGLDLGMTHIDTAELYGRGVVETIVAEAIAGRRDEVFLVSKVLPDNATRAGTLEACERSLKRLETDRLDCYLLHWPGSHPLEGTIRAFEDLVAAGKIRSWGVSNFDEEELAEALRLAGPGRIACNQVLYHLEERAIEHAVLPACEAHGIAVVGYSPFGSGRFPTRSPVLAAVAEKHGGTPRQVALAFLTRRESLFAIPKAAVVGHIQDNAGAGRVRLDDDDVKALEAAFPLARRRGGVPTL